MQYHAQVGAHINPPPPPQPRPLFPFHCCVPGLASFSCRQPYALHLPHALAAAVATAEAPAMLERDIPDMGRDLWNRSYYPTGPDAAALHKDWFIVDAAGQTLGRLAVLVSTYLRSTTFMRPVPPTLVLPHNRGVRLLMSDINLC